MSLRGRYWYLEKNLLVFPIIIHAGMSSVLTVLFFCWLHQKSGLTQADCCSWLIPVFLLDCLHTWLCCKEFFLGSIFCIICRERICASSYSLSLILFLIRLWYRLVLQREIYPMFHLLCFWQIFFFLFWGEVRLRQILSEVFIVFSKSLHPALSDIIRYEVGESFYSGCTSLCSSLGCFPVKKSIFSFVFLFWDLSALHRISLWFTSWLEIQWWSFFFWLSVSSG